MVDGVVCPKNLDERLEQLAGDIDTRRELVAVKFYLGIDWEVWESWPWWKTRTYREGLLEILQAQVAGLTQEGTAQETNGVQYNPSSGKYQFSSLEAAGFTVQQGQVARAG